MLKLIGSTSRPNSYPQLKPPKGSINTDTRSPTNEDEALLVDVKEITKDLYSAHIQALKHDLTCELVLEKRLNYAPVQGFESSINCDFPLIDTQRLNPVIRYDEYLQAITVIQFQLQILEQMLLFCEEKGATYLVLNFNDSNLDYVEIYQNLIISQEEIFTQRGEQTRIIILADVNTYDQLLDFMDEVNQKFLQDLWRDHKINTAYRAYLKSHTVLNF